MDADGVLIDTESVITEVHARPQIWNPAHELFKNVEARRQAWLDVTRAVVYNLPEFDRANQKFLERKVHMRWRTARDSYVKARATLAAGRCERRERRYGYYENMRFIDPALRRPTPAAGGKRAAPAAGGKRPTPAAGGKRATPAAGGKRSTPAAGGKRASPLDEDDDNFFKSLAPVLRTFDAHRKLAFRSRVLALALEVQAAPPAPRPPESLINGSPSAVI